MGILRYFIIDLQETFIAGRASGQTLKPYIKRKRNRHYNRSGGAVEFLVKNAD